jgi:branched-chain amino acid transport system permease protein
MIHEFKKVWKPYTIGLLWLLGLLWPLLGIHPDGTLSFGTTFTVWLYIATGTTICLLLYIMNKSGSLDAVSRPLAGFRNTLGQASGKVPTGSGSSSCWPPPSGLSVQLPAATPRMWPPMC